MVEVCGREGGREGFARWGDDRQAGKQAGLSQISPVLTDRLQRHRLQRKPQLSQEGKSTQLLTHLPQVLTGPCLALGGGGGGGNRQRSAQGKGAEWREIFQPRTVVCLLGDKECFTSRHRIPPLNYAGSQRLHAQLGRIIPSHVAVFSKLKKGFAQYGFSYLHNQDLIFDFD